MEIKLYNNHSDNDEVHKKIYDVGTYQCELHEDCTITAPKIILTMSDGVINANYCYIAKFNRYYFIREATIQNGTKVVLQLQCDVLTSFWDRFRDSKVIAKRSYSAKNKEIPDPLVVYKNKPMIKRFRSDTNAEFRPSSTGGCYILTIGGK